MRFLLRLCARHHLLYLGISIIIHTAFSTEWNIDGNCIVFCDNTSPNQSGSQNHQQ